ncbi:2-dehydro-3-deoxy-6-phosphogalactonate aldolase [Dongia rigui]|uniref:2-dehydro-3-deoxy-6-phosphogalactonate aldolase n=1 Tax=Dongia rigui TaxID=940149 RepID=A0ABU5DYK5_9PROT|nr:2-dehydro-3-deoxy-6-phosphogalactonate aldolase [Dongia rigui]MDY0872366.1 2-dehydro-3-deoxy-6-phosphogalactonate aldolase [Dongia rigui]
MTDLRPWLRDLPLIAILRGITPVDAEGAVETLHAAGWRVIEVPLNSPDALETLKRMVKRAKDLGDNLLIGAGTVLNVSQVDAIAASGAKLMVSPNCVPEVIRAAKAKGLATAPGVATPTEAFAALDAGADALKMFPGELLPPTAVKAWRAVLPPLTLLLPVGGVAPDNIAAYMKAGANGFGIGTSVYKPGMAMAEMAKCATALADAFRNAH